MDSIKVKDIYQMRGTSSISIPQETSIESITERLACEPGIRGIFVVDDSKSFVGLITSKDLMKWMHLRLYSGQKRRDISVWEGLHLAGADIASDLMQIDSGEFFVKESDTLQKVLDKMLDEKQDVLPVVDEQYKILGDIRLSEVLLKAIEISSSRKLFKD
jgi:CBS domain-containing protein